MLSRVRSGILELGAFLGRLALGAAVALVVLLLLQAIGLVEVSVVRAGL